MVLFFENSVVVLELLEMVEVVHQYRLGAINLDGPVEVLYSSLQLPQILVHMVDLGGGGYASEDVKYRNE